MESLIKLQINANKAINKAFVNFKKSPKERLTAGYLEARLEALESQWCIFSENHSKLISDYNSKELEKYDECNVYEITEELYFDYKAELKDKLNQIQLLAPTISDANYSNSNANSKQQFNCNVKLPRITIPTFSGSYAEWTSFRDLFMSLVHTNKSLDNVQKLHYLKTYLSGEADQLLRHVSITSDNYEVCWNLLNNRYNNKRYIANTVLKRFMSQRTIFTESATALKELLDTSNECINALKNLGLSTDAWDLIVIYILSLKLDNESRKMWETKVSESQDDLPTYKQFADFLQQRFRSLEFLDNKSSKNIVKARVLHVTESVECPFCTENHKLLNCKKFSKEDTDARRNFVQSQKLCFNCFGQNHTVYTCRAPSKCRICHRKHHSLLHIRNTPSTASNVCQVPSEGNSSELNKEKEKPDEPCKNIISCHISAQSHVLLATALVRAISQSGICVTLRSLLDQGSQSSFITEAAVQLLGLSKKQCKSYVSGLGGDQDSMVTSKYVVYFKIQSLINPSFVMQVKAHVLKSITTLLPDKEIAVQGWSNMPVLKLADPTFNTPNKVDILLGAEVYCQIIEEGFIRSGPEMPVAQNTKLGWILSGKVSTTGYGNTKSFHTTVRCMHAVGENSLLQKFWELEEEPKLSEERKWSDEEQKCEKIFISTTTRDSEGRYVVKLPFRSEDPQCQYGNTLAIALKRFEYLEKRLSRNLELKKQYTNVINEYVELGHMEIIPDIDIKPTFVYLPHHAVVREDKTTTKVRVVFDASCPGKNGVSLNSELMIGPKLQPDLRHIIMRWRMHPICLCSDIVKMYRQIKVTEKDANFQCIVWRENPEDNVKHLRNLRVTFGTASAPYLAVRALQQAAKDEAEHFPNTYQKVLDDFYMDDLLSGCENIEEGEKLYKEIKELLCRAGFELQKWTSNSKKLMETINEKQLNEKINLKVDAVIKILGLRWNQESDNFEYSVKIPFSDVSITKRKVISEIAKLFDPLGWLAPAIIVTKIFIQKLWISGIGWDDLLPENLLKEWISYRNELLLLQDVTIPRWMNTYRSDKQRELHGFCDASNEAYAAVVYMRAVDKEGNVAVHLITSKTKVAPIKQVCIPRLELCGAVLLSRLLQEVSTVLDIRKENIYAYTDSTVVLAWLGSYPGKWKTFIANRVSEILSTMDRKQWIHVKSLENPADIASRGVKPSEMKNATMWFTGPCWLKEKRVISKNVDETFDTDIEKKVCHVEVNIGEEINKVESKIINKFSSLRRLVRVISYCRRFRKIRSVTEKWLTSDELRESLNICIKIVQGEGFKTELKDLRKIGFVNKKSKLTALNPFLDDTGILRVGGRLERAQLNVSAKHPIILPDKSHFSSLIIADAHEKTMHGGPQLTLNYLRSRYWILNAKNNVKAFIRKCVTCIRYAASTRDQLMGQLPNARVEMCRPFYRTGVDYAGPINIRVSKGRGNKSYKGYVCLFVCMATRAVHLEAVSDMTSSGFLAAFRRFVARRGYCADLYSDNGTNFIGAAKELQVLFLSEKSNFINEVGEALANDNTKFHLIPPRAPNFGGLWEAGIKSTKYHLKRVIGQSTLTYEELSTVLTQIEACLNSRPISQLSTNPHDPFPLTPGHFLVGEPLLLVPDVNYEQSNISSLKRWQFTQRMVQDFWRRWSQEYLIQFLNRYRWAYQKPEPNIGDIVLVKEDGLPPGKWLFGLIVQKFPGMDGITRVVNIKCKDSVIKRAVSKLCVLPVTE